jgi:hypothetical protein
MRNEQKTCPTCHNPLIEIDRYGESSMRFGVILCDAHRFDDSSTFAKMTRKSIIKERC